MNKKIYFSIASVCIVLISFFVYVKYFENSEFQIKGLPPPNQKIPLAGSQVTTLQAIKLAETSDRFKSMCGNNCKFDSLFLQGSGSQYNIGLAFATGEYMVEVIEDENATKILKIFSSSAQY